MGGHKEVAEAALSDPDAAFSGEVVKIDRPSPFEGGGALSGTSGGASGGTMVGLAGLAASVSLVARLVRAGQTQGGCRCAAVGRAHPVAAVGAFLMGCAVLLALVGCAGVRSEAPEEQERGHAEATASERARCGGTRSLEGRSVPAQRKPREPYLTNDLPGCPEGGPLSGTDGRDRLYGGNGGDEVRGLGATDEVYGGLGKDVVYGGPGDDIVWGSTIAVVEAGRDKSDDVLHGGPGNDMMIDDGGDSAFYGGEGDDEIYAGEGDVVYGGDGKDFVDVGGAGRAKIYCGEGKDFYVANADDHVSSNCEEEAEVTVMY